jgi:hypothetical protein
VASPSVGGTPGGGTPGGGTPGGGTPGGGTPGGGTPGGGTPGGGTPGGSCAGTTEECRDAKLIDLTVSDYPLNQLDASQYEIDEQGFDPDVFAYSLVTSRDLGDPVTEIVSVTQSTYSTATYSIFGKGNSFVKSGSLTSDSQLFDLEIKAMEDMWIRITVTSGDGISSKVYQVYVQYPRIMQEAFKISSSTLTWLDGVPQKQYQLQRGSIEGKKIRADDSVRLIAGSDSEPFLNCESYSCVIPNEQLTQEIGVWRVEVYRGETLIAEGSYEYNINPANVLTTDIGLEVKAYTKQELIDEFVNRPYYDMPLQWGYNINIDTTKLMQNLPSAKYFLSGQLDMNGTVSSFPAGLTTEDYKLGIHPNGYNGYQMTNAYPITIDNPAIHSIYGVVATQSDWEDDPKLVNDKFVYVGVYDENFYFLGQYIFVLEFDQDHVADGYTTPGNWNPQP